MKMMRYAEAEAIAAHGPFSFIDLAGSRATRLAVCGANVTTAANCVRYQDGQLAILTWVCPLVGGAR